MESDYNQSDDYCYREQANLMSTLLADPKDKEISQQQEQIPALQEQSHEESQEEQDKVTPLNRTLLQKEQFNYSIPEKLFLQGAEDEPLLLQPANRKHPSLSALLFHRDPKLDTIAYQFQTREHKIERYRLKKHRRVWSRKVSYDCRKLVADNRERINGRFAKKSPYLTPSDFTHKSSLATGEFQSLKQPAEFKGLEEFFE